MQTKIKYARCPYCGNRNDVLIDLSAPSIEFVEDCQNCCNPILYRLYNSDDEVHMKLTAERENS